MTMPRATSWGRVPQLTVAVSIPVRTALVMFGPRLGTAEFREETVGIKSDGATKLPSNHSCSKHLVGSLDSSIDLVS